MNTRHFNFDHKSQSFPLALETGTAAVLLGLDVSDNLTRLIQCGMKVVTIRTVNLLRLTKFSQTDPAIDTLNYTYRQ